MPKLQFDLPLGDTESKEVKVSGFQVGYQETKLRSGSDIYDRTFQQILPSYTDYKDNVKEYQDFASLSDVRRVAYTHAMNNNTFSLDEQNNIMDGEGHFMGASLLYNMNAIKGYLLAEKNGFNQMGFNAVYGSITEEETNKLAKSKEGTSTLGNIVGALSAYMTEPETLVEFASPGKIMGSTISRGMLKAFGVEALYAGASETMRQEHIKKHMERAGLEYTLWDSTQEILINSGFAGLIRGIGSLVVDFNTVRKLRKDIPNQTDKEIFDAYARREQYKLTQNTTKHLHLMEQVESDVNSGKNTDVSLHTDIDINTKTDDTIEANSFVEGLSEDYKVKGYDVEEKILDDNIKAPEITDDTYGGMATKDDGDALNMEFNPIETAEIEKLEADLKSSIGNNTPTNLESTEDLIRTKQSMEMDARLNDMDFTDAIKEIDNELVKRGVVSKFDDELALKEILQGLDEASYKAPEITDDMVEELKALEDFKTRLKTVQEHPRFNEAIEGGTERSAKDIQSPQRLIQKGTVVHDLDKFGGEDKTFVVPSSYEKNYVADFTLTKSDINAYNKGKVSDELLGKIERDLEVLDTNPDYQLLKQSIGDGLEYRDGIIYKADGTELFAKGLDNLIAGGVVGIEVDENGNITLDPEKFLMGMVGLSAAKRLATTKIIREALSGLPEQTNKLVKVNNKRITKNANTN